MQQGRKSLQSLYLWVTLFLFRGCHDGPTRFMRLFILVRAGERSWTGFTLSAGKLFWILQLLRRAFQCDWFELLGVAASRD